jgi:hypothetical protein
MTNRVLYYCPDVNEPVGGIKQIYRHVDILNENNIQSAVIHEESKFKIT